MPLSSIGAAVDVGSNSVHLLVARLGAGARAGLQPLRDESVLLGLGDVVDREGLIPPPTAVDLVRVLRGYLDLARADGAAETTLVATEPLRRAANGPAVASAAGMELGEPLVVLDEQAEGELTFLGVTAGQPIGQSLLVVDIGGGSSEVVLAEPGARPQVTSLPSGSARLSAGAPRRPGGVQRDPPSAEQLARLRDAAGRLVDGLTAARPGRAVFVGGTATNLARIAPLTRDGLAEAYEHLGALPAEDVSRRFGVNLRRARQLPAGAALVEALLNHFGVAEAEVSDASLRDGAIVARHRLGAQWATRLAELLG